MILFSYDERSEDPLHGLAFSFLVCFPVGMTEHGFGEYCDIPSLLRHKISLTKTFTATDARLKKCNCTYHKTVSRRFFLLMIPDIHTQN